MNSRLRTFIKFLAGIMLLLLVLGMVFAFIATATFYGIPR
jgi:hypothetical protein